MKTIVFSLMALGLTAMPIRAAASQDGAEALDPRQKGIIPIAAFTADGDIERLKGALVKGLEAGLTVNEIKEVIAQLYAYAGFPRSLNALHAFMAVMGEREAAGIVDVQGKEATPLPADMDKDAYGAQVRARLAGWETIPEPAGYQLFAPIVDVYLKEHLFADIFARDVLTHQQRELATVAALAAMTGTAGQLGFHLGAAMNTGLTEAQMQAFVAVLARDVDPARAEAAGTVLAGVLRRR